MKPKPTTKYYKSDARTPLMLVALAQLITMCLAPVSLAAFHSWRTGAAMAAFLIFSSIKIGNYLIETTQRKIQFDNISIDSEVLYGDIEPVETVRKFKLIPDDLGGLYLDGDDVVLGSLMGEKRAPRHQFRYEKVITSGMGDHIQLTFNDERIALIPKWNGKIKERPTSSAAKVEWGCGFISQNILRDQAV